MTSIKSVNLGLSSPFLKQGIILGIGSTFIILDLAWLVFYYGLWRKVTGRYPEGVQRYVRLGCYFRAIQELFNTAVLFFLVKLFSLRIVIDNMGFREGVF